MVLTLKPAGAACNMKCVYCYYEPKAGVSRDSMSETVLEEAIRQYAAMVPEGEALQFLWHGGEPMLRPLSFYERALELQRRYAAGRPVTNSIQTNGTLIDGRWAEFMAANGWLAGVSLDGPRDSNDRYRRLGAAGSFDRVLRGIGLLNSYGVDWNAMATVNRANAGRPAEFYDFFASIGTPYLQFSPVVERMAPGAAEPAAVGEPGRLTPESVTAEEWGAFLCGVFDRWRATGGVGRVFVQLFEATLAGYVGVVPGVCLFGSSCGHAPVVEANGDVYCCDHFVFDRYRLGNIADSTLADMLRGERAAKFASLKAGGAEADPECRACRYRDICRGECPRNRFDGRRNWLCDGYRRFFAHSEKFMLQAARYVRSRQN